MGLFGNFKADREERKERQELKGQIEELMDEYDKEEIDKDTYFRNMIDLVTSHQKNNRK